MASVAMDRAVKISESRPLPYPRKLWQETRDEIFKSIYEDFWDEEVNALFSLKEARPLNALEKVDVLEGDEGIFTMCSFWHIECLAKAGQVKRARKNFEKMLGYANHLGLFAEEIGARVEHLENFPQAHTHLALISAAIELK